MPRPGSEPLLPLAVDRSDSTPLHRQLYDQVRDLILDGRLAPGARLPSTRRLALELALSRNTVTGAFDQLLAEGYLDGRVGAGTFVSTELPETGQAPDRRAGAAVSSRPRRRGPSVRGQALSGLRFPRAGSNRWFMPGLPDVERFPFDVWSRLLARPWRHPQGALATRGDPGGFAPLRAAIASYLRAARAVRCEADQVIVVSGAQQALTLAVNVLLDEGDTALIEDPGYPGLRGGFVGAGVRLATGPVDKEGFDIASAARAAPHARLACVAPSHQYPLGITMSLGRRLALLDWAARADAWILEDDFDSEYRYGGRPLASLQGLDRDGRVVYVGSFSKVLFPSLRLGYMVVPPDLTDVFLRARAALDSHPSSVVQPAMATFMEEGHFTAHIRRMRRLYAARQEALVEAVEHRLGGLLHAAPGDTGMHFVATLQTGAAEDDKTLAARAADAGLSTPPLSAYYLKGGDKRGLLMGFAAVPEDEAAPGVEKLAAALQA